MALIWWAMAAFLLTVALAWVLLPVFGEPRPWRVELQGSDARRLIQRERAKALRRVKDLEHERDAGMISGPDYDVMRRAAMEEIVLFNRRLDDLSSEPSAGAAAGSDGGAPLDSAGPSEASS